MVHTPAPACARLQTNATCSPADAAKNQCPTNNSHAITVFENGFRPGPAPLAGETVDNASFYFAGTVIDEWNPDPCVPVQIPAATYGPNGPKVDPTHNWTVPGPFIRPGQSGWCNNTPAAVAGYIKTKMKVRQASAQ